MKPLGQRGRRPSVSEGLFGRGLGWETEGDAGESRAACAPERAGVSTGEAELAAAGQPRRSAQARGVSGDPRGFRHGKGDRRPAGSRGLGDGRALSTDRTGSAGFGVLPRAELPVSRGLHGPRRREGLESGGGEDEGSAVPERTAGDPGTAPRPRHGRGHGRALGLPSLTSPSVWGAGGAPPTGLCGRSARGLSTGAAARRVLVVTVTKTSRDAEHQVRRKGDEEETPRHPET